MPSEIFQALPTPNSEEMAFRVRADAVSVFPSQIPKKYTPFNKIKWLPKPRAMQQDLGGYVYTQYSSEGDYLWFYFGKWKTEEDKKKPFNVWTKFDDHTWDLILLGVAVVPIPGFPQSTYGVVNGVKTLISATRYYGREIYIPRTTTGTQFFVEEFLSPTPFDIPKHPSPIAMPVNYEVLGVRREFPLCLHDDLQLRPTNLGLSVVAGSTGSASSGAVGGYDFPATNFTRWKPYYVHDDQQRVNGLWHRMRIRALPPKMPEPVSQPS